MTSSWTPHYCRVIYGYYGDTQYRLKFYSLISKFCEWKFRIAFSFAAMASENFRAKDISLRTQKKLLSRMSNKATLKLFIDDGSAAILDNTYRLFEKYVSKIQIFEAFLVFKRWTFLISAKIGGKIRKKFKNYNVNFLINPHLVQNFLDNLLKISDNFSKVSFTFSVLRAVRSAGAGNFSVKSATSHEPFKKSCKQ